MGTMTKECLGYYGTKMGQCDSCPLVHLCIETTISIDAYWDEQASRQQEIEEMEADYAWHEWS